MVSASHWVGLTLPGMIEEPGSFSGNLQFGESGARPARHQADVVGDLVERHRQRAQRAGQLHQRVVGALHGEFVGRGDEGQAGELGDLGGGGLGETGRRVDAGSDRRAAQRQAVDAVQRGFDPLQIVRQHPGIARPFLAQRQRRGVLHVGAPDLDDVAPRLRLRVDRVAQGGDRGNQALLHVDRRGDVHRRRKRVVRRLRHVDVIVRDGPALGCRAACPRAGSSGWRSPR